MEADKAKTLMEIEGQFRMAIRDAANRTTRKPFYTLLPTQWLFVVHLPENIPRYTA